MRNIIVTQQHLILLKTAINEAFVLPNAVLDDWLPRWDIIKLKRKQLISIAGDTQKYLYFVIKGVQRCYTVYNDKEATIVFSYPYSFTGVIDSFLLQQPAAYDFETLTDTQLLRISYTDFMQIVNKYTVMEKWLRIMLTHVTAGLLHRQKELIAFSAADKLNAVFKRSPHIFNLIPHKYIASYIGVDPATFSKMLVKQSS